MSKKYWYYFYIYTCPVCGSETRGKERRYTPKPKFHPDRYKFIDCYDWCEE